MVGAWLLTHQLPQKLLRWQACLVVSWVSKWGVSKLTQTKLRIGQDGLQTVVLGNGPKQDCFPPLPLYYMDSETMGDRNVRCLSLTGYYRLRVHWGSHWLEKFGAKFWRDFLAPFFKQTMRDRILHSRSSFPSDTRKVNTGFIWQWILTILTKFYGGYFSRFYKSLIKVVLINALIEKGKCTFQILGGWQGRRTSLLPPSLPPSLIFKAKIKLFVTLPS